MRKTLLLAIMLSFVAFTTGIGIVNAASLGDSGVDVIVNNNTLTVRGFTYIFPSPSSGLQKYSPPNGTNLGVETFIGSIGSGISCESEVVNLLNGTNMTVQKNCILNISFSKEFLWIDNNFTNSSSPAVTDTDTLNKLTTCINERAQFSAGLDSCVKDKQTFTDVSSNYTNCNNELVQCRADKGVAESEKNRLTTEAEGKKNQHYVWGVIGVIAGILGALWYTGRIGGGVGKIRRPEEKYNVNQAG
jgi:hypothetical protein